MTLAGVGLVVLGIALVTGRKHTMPILLAVAGSALIVGWSTFLAAVLGIFGT